MLDKKSIALLKVLNKLTQNNTYKVVTGEELISYLPQKHLYDLDIIKSIFDFLEKQEYINIKFSEENTYCFSLLPKARVYLEQNTKTKTKPQTTPVITYFYTMISSFIGSMLALLLFIYLTF